MSEIKHLPFNRELFDIQVKTVKRGTIILHNGETSNCFFYVLKGCLRSYTIDTKGKEHVFQFAPEDWVVGDLNAVLNNEPALFSIDALEDSEVQIIRFRETPALDQFDRELIVGMNVRFGKRIVTLQKRIMQLLSWSAEERYIEFIRIYPNLSQRVPQKMIASYLGITPEGLSRVRKNLVKK